MNQRTFDELFGTLPQRLTANPHAPPYLSTVDERTRTHRNIGSRYGHGYCDVETCPLLREEALRSSVHNPELGCFQSKEEAEAFEIACRIEDLEDREDEYLKASRKKRDWCFLLVYVFLACVVVILILEDRRRAREQGEKGGDW